MRKCILCRLAAVDELRLGKLYLRGEIAVHQNCLYLSSNLVQRGNGRNGILNFTYNDILAESERTKYLHCCYCNRRGANVGCCKSGCRRTFHTYCGLENCSQNQFIGTFKSFCNMHVNTYPERPKHNDTCVICFETLIKKNHRFCCTKYIYGKCCKNGWYHKDCLQRYANSAGYFFKCPLCNDTERFNLVALWGISVPNRDASWEDNDAYADQLVLPTDCTARNCANANGRKGSMETLLYCIMCGSNPVHTECTSIKNQDFCCEDCSVVLNRPLEVFESHDVDDDEDNDANDSDDDDNDNEDFKNEKDNVNSAAAAPTVMQPNNEQLRTRNIQQRGMGNRRTLAAETVSTRLRTRSRSSHTRSRSPVGELVERRSSRNHRQSPDRAQMDTSPLIWRGRQRLRSRNTERAYHTHTPAAAEPAAAAAPAAASKNNSLSYLSDRRQQQQQQ
ncbi:PHD finger protein 7 [Drosophila hydei]|uniref:PHD finger protein 7 n=1 Tax=Drosophila hydei TaxID=7224 RepID=A0A6J1LS82_DROHY|nr:PHD finger protein 7 [Drosophila hydei]